MSEEVHCCCSTARASLDRNPLTEQIVLFFGAGEAGTGIAKFLVRPKPLWKICNWAESIRRLAGSEKYRSRSRPRWRKSRTSLVWRAFRCRKTCHLTSNRKCTTRSTQLTYQLGKQGVPPCLFGKREAGTACLRLVTFEQMFRPGGDGRIKSQWIV